jgi:hypothetical protein
MNLRASVAWSIALALSAAFVSCSSGSDEPHEECDEIATLCHEVADVSEAATLCHDQAHAGDLEACHEIHHECLALCEDLLGVGGAGGDAGASGR